MYRPLTMGFCSSITSTASSRSWNSCSGKDALSLGEFDCATLLETKSWGQLPA